MSRNLLLLKTKLKKLEQVQRAWEEGMPVSIVLKSATNQPVEMITKATDADAHLVGLPLYAAIETLNQQIDQLTAPAHV